MQPRQTLLLQSDFFLPLYIESGKYMEIKNGFVANPNRFEEMFTTYYPELVIYLCKFIKEKTVAEDIVQETFCELWSKKDTYPISNVRGFFSVLSAMRQSTILPVKKE